MHVSAPGSPSSNYMAPSEAEDHVLCHTQYKITLMKKHDTHENKHEKVNMKNMVNITIML